MKQMGEMIAWVIVIGPTVLGILGWMIVHTKDAIHGFGGTIK